MLVNSALRRGSGAHERAKVQAHTRAHTRARAHTHTQRHYIPPYQRTPVINARNECDYSHVRWIEPHAFVGVGQRSLPLRHLEPALRTVGPQCCVCRVDLDGLGVVNGRL
jgi:hypothetical protein